MDIRVIDDELGTAVFGISELAAVSPLHFPVQERVDAVSGQAFDWLSWYKAWREGHRDQTQKQPTHLQVEASDGFEALVPWPELTKALFLYAQDDGEPLQKGYPVRLYVPDGSSACLNVKSVVTIRIKYDASSGNDASYGFKNKFSPDELLNSRKPS